MSEHEFEYSRSTGKPVQVQTMERHIHISMAQQRSEMISKWKCIDVWLENIQSVPLYWLGIDLELDRMTRKSQNRIGRCLFS
jgi:hypothetical protein